MSVTINGTTGISGVAGTASAPALVGSDADSGFFINSANEPSASVNGTAVWNATSNFGFKNRLINGAMMIDQRNAGGLYTSPASNTYQLDRWCCNVGGGGFNVQQNAGSVTPPAGFKNYYGVTSTSTSAASNYSIRQFIEGFNTADLMYGTANAKTTTLSFWIYSSLTGTFGGAIQNSAGNRSYVYSYTINAANTWQYVTVTIPGDTGGTWIGATNGAGLVLYISYSVAAGQTGGTGAWTGNDYRAPTGQVNLLGTNGATWYITGVQLEVGSTATSFDFRSIGTELALCQRYFLDLRPSTSGYIMQYPTTLQSGSAGSGFEAFVIFPVKMRTAPSSVLPSSMTGLSLNWPFPGSSAITSLTSAPYLADLGACIQGIQTNAFGSAFGSVGFQIGYNASSIGFTAEF